MLILIEDLNESIEVSDTDDTGDVIVRILLKNKDKICNKLFIDGIEIIHHCLRRNIGRFKSDQIDTIKITWSKDKDATTNYLNNLCRHIQYCMEKTEEIISLYKIIEDVCLNQRFIEYNARRFHGPLDLSDKSNIIRLVKHFFKLDCDEYNDNYNEYPDIYPVLKYRLIKYVRDYGLENLNVNYNQLSDPIKHILLDIDDI